MSDTTKEITVEEQLERLSAIFDNLLPKVAELAYELRRAAQEYENLIAFPAHKVARGIAHDSSDAAGILDLLAVAPFGEATQSLTKMRTALECAERIGQAMIRAEVAHA